jgi:hypothetical protein
MNTPKLRQLETAAVVALEKTAEALKTEVINAQVMPFDVGTMQNDCTSIVNDRSTAGEASINVDTSYAARLFYHPEYNFKHTNNPNARGEWFEPWIDGDKKDFAPNTFNTIYKREAGL